MARVTAVLDRWPGPAYDPTERGRPEVDMSELEALPNVEQEDPKAQERLLDAAITIAASPDGKRNDTLNTEAFHIGYYVWTGKLDAQKVADALIKASRKCGLDDDEAIPTLLRGILGAYIHPDSRATVQPLEGAALDIASDLHILDRFKSTVRLLGVVGEVAVACVVFLCITSRVLGRGPKERPVSAHVKGTTASGKSWTVEQTVKFFPRRAVYPMTAMSEKALPNSKEDFKHRTIILYEATGLQEGREGDLTAYFLRTLLSEGRIAYQVSERRNGKWETVEKVKEGPTNLVLTTTKVTIHDENETRALSLTTNDTRDQTKNIFRELANEDAREVDLTPWHEFQAWIQGAAEHRVTIPYGPALAEIAEPTATRLRRDFGAVLSLIRTHAILHQQNRARDSEGRIIASLDDYEAVRHLVDSVISEGMGLTVSKAVRDTVEALAALSGKDKDEVTAKALGEKLRLDKSTTSRRLAAARRGGYVVNNEDKRGKPGRWVPGAALPGDQRWLPDAEGLLQPHNPIATEPPFKTAGQRHDPASGCTLARESGDKSEPSTNGSTPEGLPNFEGLFNDL